MKINERILKIIEKYELILVISSSSSSSSVCSCSNLNNNEFIQVFFSSLINMLSPSSGFEKILEILQIIIEILQSEYNSLLSSLQPSQEIKEFQESQELNNYSTTILIEIIGKSQLLEKLNVLYSLFHSYYVIISLISEVFELLSKLKVKFQKINKKNSLLQDISLDILHNYISSSNDLYNYCIGFDALSQSKIINKHSIIKSYLSCIQKLIHFPKSRDLTFQLFMLILNTDWSSNGTFSLSHLSHSSTISKLLNSFILLPFKSSNKFIKRIKSCNYDKEKKTSKINHIQLFIQQIIEISIKSFLIQIKSLSSNSSISSRDFFYQLSCLAYRNVFLSSLSSLSSNFHSNSHSKSQSYFHLNLHSESSQIDISSILSQYSNRIYKMIKMGHNNTMKMKINPSYNKSCIFRSQSCPPLTSRLTSLQNQLSNSLYSTTSSETSLSTSLHQDEDNYNDQNYDEDSNHFFEQDSIPNTLLEDLQINQGNDNMDIILKSAKECLDQIISFQKSLQF